ncbi:MAG: hypothetical protein ACREF7_03965, partial [Candidatus Saccharimonadales bacterium]
MGERLESVINQPIEDQGLRNRTVKAVAAGLLVAGGVIGFAANRTSAAERTDGGVIATASPLENPHDGTVPANVNIIVDGASSSVSDVVDHSITFLSDNEHIKGYKSVKPASCVWEKSFWNSGGTVNNASTWNKSNVEFFVDHNGELCRDPSSPTGWVKVAGGKTGRDCGNIAKPMGPIPGRKAPGKVELVANFNTKATISAEATANATAECVGTGNS